MLFVTLALVFETLGARFHSVSSFLIALTLVDREQRALFLVDHPHGVGCHSVSAGITVTNTGEGWSRSATRVSAFVNL